MHVVVVGCGRVGSGLARAVAVARLGISQVADGSLIVQEGDVLYLAVAGDAVDKLDAHLGIDATKQKGGT